MSRLLNKALADEYIMWHCIFMHSRSDSGLENEAYERLTILGKLIDRKTVLDIFYTKQRKNF